MPSASLLLEILPGSAMAFQVLSAVQALGKRFVITELQTVMIEHNVTEVETTGMIETNQKAIQVWQNYEHIQHKRRRSYVKMF